MVIWYVAQCLDCHDRFKDGAPIPFSSEDQRYRWVFIHQQYTGHQVARWEEDAGRFIVSHVETGSVM